ncbi:MCP methyltransferase, CheR-type [Poseidonocella pacifica]|uniref:Chemotaxis protein methyltransferase n=1 Tax=Poseidonocella pacifica TaxID=871651 RepID=A0A1I0VES2_9RHOB|nr:protein-glutamate O-methyltransferase [Poseidonocella pacifica]SFA74865.1 MCP methyltransferase, CheR-type [Poseidonocella pacifica]
MSGLEFNFTEADFRTLSRLALEDAGIELNEGKRTLVYSRLAKRLRSLGLRDFSEYCSLIQEHEGAQERRHFVSQLTTNVTKFYRESHHFDHLSAHAIGQIREKTRRGQPVRIWSAACSSGEEPYSIAIELAKHMTPQELSHIKILATDIDNKILASASKGIYPATALANLAPELRQRFFTETDQSGALQVSTEIRQLVTFRHLNLIKTWPVKGPFDAVFCRNVAIYFPDNIQHDLWENFSRVIAKDGFLYIGHSERITGATARRFTSKGATIYQLTDAVGARSNA